MANDKTLTIKQKARLKKLNHLCDENRETVSFLTREREELKNEIAVILCPFKLGDKVIREDGLIGIVSKIKLRLDKTPVISVFKKQIKPAGAGRFLSEHYRTKETEVWELHA